MTSRAARLALLLASAAASPTLAAAPAAATDAATAVAPAPNDDDSIIVTGAKPRTEVFSATKTDTPIIETPQSISVVSSGDIAQLGLQNLNQALRFVAGITPEQRGSSAEVYDQFKLRGFDALQYLDGLRSFDSPSGYASSQIDVSRLDRIEVVKGPASALYGQTGPGGLVALSSKLPLDRDFYGSVAGTYGTFDLYRADVDVGGRLSPLVTWRTYASVNGAHTQQRFGKRERQTYSAAATLGQGSATSFTVLANYSHDPYNGTYGVFPASGTFIRNPNGRLPTKFDGGERGNRFQREQFAISYFFDHDFGHDWHFRTLGRYQYVHSRLGLVYTGGTLDATDPTQQTFNRASYSTRERLNFWTYDNQLTGKVVTGPVTHRLLFGADRQVLHSTETYAFGTASPLNAYNPVYGTQPVPHTPETVPNPFGGVGNLAYNVRQQGVYAQDEMALAGLRVTVSGRQDWARVLPVGSSEQNSRKFTYRAAGLYKFDFGLAPYVSYSTSFQPQSGLVIAQSAIGSANPATLNADPSLGRQIEGGLKYQVPNTQIVVTGAYFDIRQSNLLTSIPNTPYSVQSGRVRSRGFEAEATAPLPYDFEAKLAFSRQKVRTIDTDPLTRAVTKGRVLGVGKGGTSFNLEWAPKEGPLGGFAVGGAVRHVDRVFAGTYFDGITRTTPSYTLFDALLRYDLGRLSPRLSNLNLAVNATNIFDKKYLSTCYTDYGWCWYGNRRTVQGTISYAW